MWFKRPGQRCILDQAGQLKVRPNPLELQLQVLPPCPCSCVRRFSSAPIEVIRKQRLQLGRQQQQCFIHSYVQASRKIAVHFLEAYRIALLAALRLQFTRRGLPDGHSGVLAMLAGNSALRELLAAEGCVTDWHELLCDHESKSCTALPLKSG